VSYASVHDVSHRPRHRRAGCRTTGCVCAAARGGRADAGGWRDAHRGAEVVCVRDAADRPEEHDDRPPAEAALRQPDGKDRGRDGPGWKADRDSSPRARAMRRERRAAVPPRPPRKRVRSRRGMVATAPTTTPGRSASACLTRRSRLETHAHRVTAERFTASQKPASCFASPASRRCR